jgi:hypothetical protein
MLLWPQTVASQSAGTSVIEVVVLDQSARPLRNVLVQLKMDADQLAIINTDATGHAVFVQLRAGRYEITAQLEGFELGRAHDLIVSQAGPISVELALIPRLSRRESLEVRGTATPLEGGAASPVGITAQTAKALPNRPATVADALPMIPGVVREPGGGLVISASPEHRTALIVNSADVTDPATGQFGLTVPVDSVEALNVYQTPYLGEFGKFTAGVVSVETRRGSDQWKWELNDRYRNSAFAATTSAGSRTQRRD